MPKYKILFDSFHLYHLPQFDPVIDLLRSDDRFEVKVTTSPLNVDEEVNLTLEVFEQRGFDILFDNEMEGLKSKILDFDPDVFICGWSRYPVNELVPEKTLVGMIYHGIGVKPSYWLDNHPRLDLRFVEGIKRVEQLQEKGVDTELELTGFTKLDPIFNGNVKTREETLKELNLDPEKRTILLAPTFYPSSFESYGQKILEYAKDYNLIIKLHMWVYFKEEFGSVSLKPQRKLAEKLKKAGGNVVILDPHHYNIIPFYEAADVLVTEASSTIYEMLAVGKPVIVASFYKLYLSHRLFRNRLYKKRLDEKMTRDISRFCISIDSPRQLPAALEKVFSGGYKPAEELSEWINNWMHDLDGKASERVRDSIIARLQKS